MVAQKGHELAGRKESTMAEKREHWSEIRMVEKLAEWLVKK